MQQPEIPLMSKGKYFAMLKAAKGDSEKVPTAEVDSLTYLGICVASRYGQARELEIMLNMVDAVYHSDACLEIVRTISCDSKAGDTYSVTVLTGTEGQVEKLGGVLNDFMAQTYGGHNGIYIVGPGIYLDIPAWWAGDEDGLSQEDERQIGFAVKVHADLQCLFRSVAAQGTAMLLGLDNVGLSAIASFIWGAEGNVPLSLEDKMVSDLMEDFTDAQMRADGTIQ